jgi:hypothetical protein
MSNVPALLALQAPPARIQIAPRQSAAPHQSAAHVAAATCADPTSERRNVGPRVRNPGRNARFTGNNTFANTVRSRRVEEAIDLAGGQETLLKIDCDGVSIGVCVYYHG